MLLKSPQSTLRILLFCCKEVDSRGYEMKCHRATFSVFICETVGRVYREYVMDN